MRFLNWLTRLFETNDDRDMQIHWLKARNAKLKENVESLLKQDGENERNRQEINRLLRENNELKYGMKPVSSSTTDPAAMTDEGLIAKAKTDSWTFYGWGRKNARPVPKARPVPANSTQRASHSWPASGTGTSRSADDDWSRLSGVGIATSIALNDASPSASQGSCPSPASYGSSPSSSSDSGSSFSSCE